jgi:hypothetical protein
VGSIPVEVIRLFNGPNAPNRIVALGSTQPLKTFYVDSLNYAPATLGVQSWVREQKRLGQGPRDTDRCKHGSHVAA